MNDREQHELDLVEDRLRTDEEFLNSIEAAIVEITDGYYAGLDEYIVQRIRQRLTERRNNE